jgi:hypothetical protein
MGDTIFPAIRIFYDPPSPFDPVPEKFLRKQE